MGRRGPPPLPTKIRVLHGERHKARINQAEPQPREVDPVCPDHLQGYAVEVWHRVVAELKVMRLAFDSDREVLAAYCVAASRHHDACVGLNRTGFLLRSTKPDVPPYVNPLVYVERTQAELMVKLAGQFGLTPSARVNLKADREPLADHAESLLSG
jgi:P27 family predicted phage terminase small subunit